MNTKIFAKIISIDWESALLSYCTKSISFIKIKLVDKKGNVHSWKSTEANNVGRMELTGLSPNNSYSGYFESSEDNILIEFQTLPAPEGKQIASYAVIADPHVSCKNENRKGRFLFESAMILRDVVGLCNSLNPDCVLIPGDITNDGTEKEYSLASEILQELTMPCITTPGNHDFSHGESSIKCWDKYFPTKSNIYEMVNKKIITLNSAKGCLLPNEIHSLYSLLKENSDDSLIIMSHYQLFDNEHISRGASRKVVEDTIEQEKLLNLIREKQLLIYAGHQNVCSVKAIGKSFQINVPQPVQHPCGFLYVSQYKNGSYHKFIPISSEILRQWSNVSGEQAASLYKQDQWESLYREGKDLHQTNFLVNF